jgi:hypothetical protein
MKVDIWKSAACALGVALAVSACQTAPGHTNPAEPASAASASAQAMPEIPAVKPYANRHGIVFRYPASWHVEDLTLNYDDLEAAAEEGGAYIQVYSYDRTTAIDPTAPVPASEVKIMIVMAKNTEKLDYPQVLGELGNDVVDRAVFMIDGKRAYKVHYRIQNQESGGKLDILSILLVDRDYIIRFICYPWNSRYEYQFEKLAASFQIPRR